MIVDKSRSCFKYVEISRDGIKHHSKPFLYFYTTIDYTVLSKEDLLYVTNKCTIFHVKMSVFSKSKIPKTYIKKNFYNAKDIEYIKANYSKGLVFMYEDYFKEKVKLPSLRSFIWRLKKAGEI